MLQYLENLRKKPEPERKKAVLLISLGVTLAIALVWGIFVFMRISRTDFTFDTKPLDGNVPSLSETFSNFFDQVGNIFESDIATGTSATNTSSR